MGLVKSIEYGKNTNQVLFRLSWDSIKIEILLGVHENNSYFTHNIIISIIRTNTNRLGRRKLARPNFHPW